MEGEDVLRRMVGDIMVIAKNVGLWYILYAYHILLKLSEKQTRSNPSTSSGRLCPPKLYAKKERSEGSGRIS